MWPLAIYLAPLCLSLLVYNVGLPRVSMWIKWVNTEKTFDSECSINVTWKKWQGQNFVSSISDIKNYTLGTSWWSSGQDSTLPMQEAPVRYQVRELDFTCCKEDQRSWVPQDPAQSNKYIKTNKQKNNPTLFTLPYAGSNILKRKATHEGKTTKFNKAVKVMAFEWRKYGVTFSFF